MGRAWLVRAGRSGESEMLALDAGIIVIGWSELRDLSGVATKDDLGDLLRRTYPDAKPRRLLNHRSQLWAFRHSMAIGDLAVLPLKTSGTVAVGRVTGAYMYLHDLPPTARHVRTVDWLTTDVPRDALGQDLLHTLGAAMTVCEVKRNSGAQRLEAVAATGNDPGPG
jgi:restriction system protein